LFVLHLVEDIFMLTSHLAWLSILLANSDIVLDVTRHFNVIYVVMSDVSNEGMKKVSTAVNI